MRTVSIVVLAGVLWGGGGEAAAQAFTFVRIAQDFEPGLGFINGNVPPDIATDGTVIFAGSEPATGEPRLFVGDGGPLFAIVYQPSGYSDVKSPQVNGNGDVIFRARREDGADDYLGIYRTTSVGGPILTLYETLDVPFDPDPSPPQSNVVLSEVGQVAVSTIVNGDGALLRGPVAGPLDVLRDGSGTYFNTKEVAFNDAGTLGVQMEYTDPTMGLSRGILLFDTPGDTLDTIDTAIEKLGVSVQPVPSINAAGEVGFSLTASPTTTFYDPPDDAAGDVVAVIDYMPGVYVSVPTPFGFVNDVQLIADTSGAFQSFGKVLMLDDGVVFSASFDSGGGVIEQGIFAGPDPVADKVMQTGVDLQINGDDYFFSIVRLGEATDGNRFTIQTSDFNTTDQQVWRVEVDFPNAPLFIRGNVNGDANVNFRDLRALLRFLAGSGAPLGCADSADVQDDGVIDGRDAFALLLHLITGLPLPAPSGTCGIDPTPDELDCGDDGPCP